MQRAASGQLGDLVGGRPAVSAALSAPRRDGPRRPFLPRLDLCREHLFLRGVAGGVEQGLFDAGDVFAGEE